MFTAFIRSELKGRKYVITIPKQFREDMPVSIRKENIIIPVRVIVEWETKDDVGTAYTTEPNGY